MPNTNVNKLKNNILATYNFRINQTRILIGNNHVSLIFHLQKTSTMEKIVEQKPVYKPKLTDFESFTNVLCKLRAELFAKLI